MKVELNKIFKFAAAHKIKCTDINHKCSQLHGHNYKVEVIIRGKVNNNTGWLIDYDQIANIINPIIDRLDHKYLNQISKLEIGEGLELIFDAALADQTYDQHNLRFIASGIISILDKENKKGNLYKHEIDEESNCYKIIRLI